MTLLLAINLYGYAAGGETSLDPSSSIQLRGTICLVYISVPHILILLSKSIGI